MTPQELAWTDLSGRSLSVDGYNALYQFLATIRQRDGQPFTDANGRVTSHLVGLLSRTSSLLANGVRTAWVFDGRPSDLKAQTLSARFAVKERAEEAWAEALAAGDLVTARRKAAQTSRLTRPMVEDARAVLEALGLPTVQAPSEGEAQAAFMAARGLTWAAASEDYDTLLFGAPRLVRGLAARPVQGNQPAAKVVDRAKWLSELGISDEELLALALIVGTDFNEGVPGYGPKKALKLVQQHLGFGPTLERAGIDPGALQPVVELFRTPPVEEIPSLRFAPVDEERLVRLLVDGHGFSPERVHQAALRAARGTTREESTAFPRAQQKMLESFGESDS